MHQRLAISLTLLVMLLAACRQPALPALTAEEIVANASARMNGTSGFHFIIERSGAPAYLDAGETLSFRRAEGDYMAPDRSQATVRIIAPGLVTDVDVISVGAVQWETNLLTRQWEELPPNWGFNPNVLFDAEVGLQPILTADLSNLKLLDPEKLDGGPDQRLYHLNGSAAGQRLFTMSGGLIGPQSVDVELWVAPETFELYRILVIEPVSGADEASIWQVDFTQFDLSLQIEPPLMQQQ